MVRKIKGLLFGGCSFTWGQGLYHYSNLSYLQEASENRSFNSRAISEAMIRHKNSIRFPRLVANHLNTFEVCKDDIGKLYGNGGSEDETFDFFDYLFLTTGLTMEQLEVNPLFLSDNVPDLETWIYISIL